MKAVILNGLAISGGFGALILGILEAAGSVNMFQLANTSKNIVAGLLIVIGLGILSLTFITNGLASFFGISVARLIVGLVLLGAIAWALYLSTTILQSAVRTKTTGVAAGLGIADILLILMGLFVARKTLLHAF